MIQTLTLTGITLSPEKTNKNGKAYKILTVNTNDGRRMSCFINFPDQPELQIQEGQEYPCVVEQNGQYWNFKLAKKNDLFEDRLSQVEKRMDKMSEWAKTVEPRLK